MVERQAEPQWEGTEMKKTSDLNVEHDLISLEKTRTWRNLCQGPFSSSNLNCLDQQVSWESWIGAHTQRYTTHTAYPVSMTGAPMYTSVPSKENIKKRFPMIVLMKFNLKL